MSVQCSLKMINVSYTIIKNLGILYVNLKLQSSLTIIFPIVHSWMKVIGSCVVTPVFGGVSHFSPFIILWFGTMECNMWWISLGSNQAVPMADMVLRIRTIVHSLLLPE